MKVDVTALVAALREVPEAPREEYPEELDYLLRNVYEPLRRDEPVLFSQLDFEAFSEEDVSMLSDWLQEHDYKTDRLITLNRVFCVAEPVSRPSRAFC